VGHVQPPKKVAEQKLPRYLQDQLLVQADENKLYFLVVTLVASFSFAGWMATLAVVTYGAIHDWPRALLLGIVATPITGIIANAVKSIIRKRH
jgi:hypothetical protein